MGGDDIYAPVTFSLNVFIIYLQIIAKKLPSGMQMEEPKERLRSSMRFGFRSPKISVQKEPLAHH